MSATTINNYKFSFIFDLRNTEDDADKVLADIKETITQLGGEAGESENLGVREFAQVADRRFAQGQYIQLAVKAAGSLPAEFRTKLVHDRRINRIFVENV